MLLQRIVPAVSHWEHHGLKKRLYLKTCSNTLAEHRKHQHLITALLTLRVAALTAQTAYMLKT